MSVHSAGMEKARHKTWLIKRIAWRMQANEEGDLPERARRLVKREDAAKPQLPRLFRTTALGCLLMSIPRLSRLC